MNALRWLIPMVFLACAPVQAQDATFVASVDPSTVAAGEQFSVVFMFSGSEMPDSKEFQPPSFDPFVVLSGPNPSTSVQIVNGRMSSTVSYTYYLYVRSPGTYTIGSATLKHRGQVLRTTPLQVQVVQAKPQTGNTRGQQAQTQAAGVTADNLFIRAVASRQRVRLGEQLTVTYKLYTQVGISDYGLSKVPAYGGFWAEDLEVPKTPQVTTESYEGKQYRVVLLRKTALFPTQSGSLTLDPLKVKCAVQVQARRRSNDPFDIFNDPFFTRFQTVEYEVESNTLSVRVDPLPGSAPEGFSGAVGTFEFSASLDKRTVQAGDPLTLTLEVRGTGNVKLVAVPRPRVPADVETYDPKISESVRKEGTTVGGMKKAEYLLIPRNPGQRTLEPIAFTYFDLNSGRYVTLRSPKFDLTVTPGKESTGRTVASLSKEDVRLLGEDIRFLKLDAGALQPLDRSSFFTWWFILGLVVPPLVLFSAVMYRKRLEGIAGNASRWRSQQAGREASRRLRMARRLLTAGNTEEYHAEVSRALLGYLREKLQIPQAELTLDLAMERLLQTGLEPSTLAEVRSVVERAEFARFAPGGDTQTARRELLDAAAAIIGVLERNLSTR